MSEPEQTESALARWPVFLAGAGLGLIAAYILDPEHGPRRRTRLRDQSLAVKHRTFTDFKSIIARAWAKVRRVEVAAPVVDDVSLVQRVRTEFGEVARFAQAVRVDADDGMITLSGPVLNENINRLITCVRAVPGVRGVVDRLDRHERESHLAH